MSDTPEQTEGRPRLPANNVRRLHDALYGDNGDSLSRRAGRSSMRPSEAALRRCADILGISYEALVEMPATEIMGLMEEFHAFLGKFAEIAGIEARYIPYLSVDEFRTYVSRMSVQELDTLLAISRRLQMVRTANNRDRLRPIRDSIQEGWSNYVDPTVMLGPPGPLPVAPPLSEMTNPTMLGQAYQFIRERLGILPNNRPMEIQQEFLNSSLRTREEVRQMMGRVGRGRPQAVIIDYDGSAVVVLPYTGGTGRPSYDDRPEVYGEGL